MRKRQKRILADVPEAENGAGENSQTTTKKLRTRFSTARQRDDKAVGGKVKEATGASAALDTSSSRQKSLKPSSNISVNKSTKKAQMKRTKESQKQPLKSMPVETNDTISGTLKNKFLNDLASADERSVTLSSVTSHRSDSSSDVGVRENTSDRFMTDLLSGGLRKGKTMLNLNALRPWAENSKNIMHFFQQFSLGLKCRCQLQQSILSPIVKLVSDFKVCRVASPFDRRVTSLEWHPSKPNILGVGSKGGDIILWDTDNVDKDKLVRGIGAAGSCQAIKFWPWNLDKIVSASINGTVTLHDFDCPQGEVLADTMDSYNHWYCSLDVNPTRYMVAAGRNNGILHLMSTEGRKVFEYRLHKGKITHVEFSPREDWLLCTASVDKTVQLWDIRHMKDRGSAVNTLMHERPVNSAYFSQTDGCRLLTTDQNNEIRVYQAPSWHLETSIMHPHRFFQHITPFKATWHPLQDLIVCGRYPDKNFPGYTENERRSLDLFDAGTGQIVKRLYDPGVDGLCPLNKFNKRGDALATGMGFHIVLWNRKEFVEQKQSELKANMASSLEGLNPSMSGIRNRGGGTLPRPKSRPRGKQGPESDVDDLKKTKTKRKNEQKELKMKKK